MLVCVAIDITMMLKTILYTCLAVSGTAFSTGSTTVRHSTKLFDNSNIEEQKIVSRRNALSKFLVGTAAITSSVIQQPSIANAEDARRIGNISGSGLVFKDKLVVDSFDDPKVKGVTLYVSNFERPLTERVQKDFFTEPSYASVTAVKTGPIEIADNIDKSDKGEPVFKESRSLLFKELRVQRIYDEEKKAVVYISFNTRLDKNSDSNKSRFKSSISAISLE